MSRYRVMWTDSAGEGRWHDVEADSDAAAAFMVATDQDSTHMTFEGVLPLIPATDSLTGVSR